MVWAAYADGECLASTEEAYFLSARGKLLFLGQRQKYRKHVILPSQHQINLQ